MICQYRRKVFVYVLCCILLFSACRQSNPYSQDIAEEILLKYLVDIETVNEYLRKTNYSFVHIESADGNAYADFTNIKIEDSNVNEAIKRLLSSNIFLEISMSKSTVEYPLWIGYEGTICGLAYSINETALPDMDYIIELIPFSKTGWYYYISNFDEWRVRHSRRTSSSTGDGLREP